LQVLSAQIVVDLLSNLAPIVLSTKMEQKSSKTAYRLVYSMQKLRKLKNGGGVFAGEGQEGSLFGGACG
jgi:hypothetical protein